MVFPTEVATRDSASFAGVLVFRRVAEIAAWGRWLCQLVRSGNASLQLKRSRRKRHQRSRGRGVKYLHGWPPPLAL